MCIQALFPQALGRQPNNCTAKIRKEIKFLGLSRKNHKIITGRRYTSRELLKNENRDVLLDFIIEYAATDARFSNAIDVRFGRPEYHQELNKTKELINIALDRVMDHSTHDMWGNACFFTGDIVEEIWQRANQGHLRLAFAEAELLYRKLIGLFEYQGECEISDEVESCIDMMLDIANMAVSEDDKEYIYKCCIELLDLDDGENYGVYCKRKLLRISAKFVTAENYIELDQFLTKLHSEKFKEFFKTIRQDIIKKLRIV